MAERLTLLVIDDETPIRRLLKAGLDPTLYHVVEAKGGAEGLRTVATANPDVVLLDLGLPDMEGTEVTRRMREWSDVPVIILSARGQESDKVQALDCGADDYMTKPFGLDELQARIRVAVRHARARKGPPVEPVFESDDLQIDVAARTVRANGQAVHLTPTEFKLLAMLVRHAGLVVTHRQLLEEVWGPAYVNEFHYLRVYMGQLRHKLEADPSNPRHLTTEPGVGYRLVG